MSRSAMAIERLTTRVAVRRSSWEYLSASPEAGARFDRGMAGTATLRNRPLLERDWAGTRLVVDVGIGHVAQVSGVMHEDDLQI